MYKKLVHRAIASGMLVGLMGCASQMPQGIGSHHVDGHAAMAKAMLQQLPGFSHFHTQVAPNLSARQIVDNLPSKIPASEVGKFLVHLPSSGLRTQDWGWDDLWYYRYGGDWFPYYEHDDYYYPLSYYEYPNFYAYYLDDGFEPLSYDYEWNWE